MESVQHLKISVIVSPFIALLSFESLQTPEFLAVSLLGVAIGTLIDLDHFVIARLLHGNWNDLKNALNSPIKIMKDNHAVREQEIGNKNRFISHLAILWLAQLTLFVNDEFGLFAVSMIGSHIAADLYASTQSRDRGHGQESSEKQSQD
jgi:hypothetical protein